MCICNNGIVFAHSKEPEKIGPYVFRCAHCSQDFRVRKFPVFQSGREYIATYEDEMPRLEFIKEHVEKQTTQSAEFQRRLKIWGRPKFEALYRAYKTWKEFEDQRSRNREIRTTPGGLIGLDAMSDLRDEVDATKTSQVLSNEVGKESIQTPSG